MSRASSVAVNNVVMIPTVIVTAKPRTGPLPKHEQHDMRQQGGDVAIDDRAVGAAEAGFHRL